MRTETGTPGWNAIAWNVASAAWSLSSPLCVIVPSIAIP